ncbi:HNH endonuclease family protein [Paraliomyxa miuraensis]|uniref:hypothetical protein n=1 Tax=Paraliomyxa miuraensis TaxID=376150 RepID=UPI002252B00D|nr:hypothetical protein [Paraliomyxa miuraensis]MCX4243727.1 hypothetical protein [Paraliomyxa miuraensis]
MRFHKGREPTSLRRWRTNNLHEDSWEALDVAVKVKLRDDLSRDQHGVCCYCYGPTDVAPRIEHIQARTNDNIFAWDNLALACSGAEGQPASEHHCDKRKGNRPLRVVHPYSNPVINLVRVSMAGHLKGHADDDALREDIDHTLNLNGRRPMQARQKALLAALAELPKDRKWTIRRIAGLLARMRSDRAPIPYCAWVEQWLEAKLASR